MLTALKIADFFFEFERRRRIGGDQYDRAAGLLTGLSYGKRAATALQLPPLLLVLKTG